MSDDDEHVANGALSAHTKDAGKDAGADETKGSSSDDDDSSSSSSGSSSDSDSDSDSDKEGDGDKSATEPRRSSDDRKHSIESVGSNGLAKRDDKQLAEPINVNSTLAAARFREQASTEPGLMALGTKKRDRRTIEEIQRDIQKKRGRPASSLPSSSSSTGVKKVIGPAPVARASPPPKSSPVMSPDSGNEMERMSLGLGGTGAGAGVGGAKATAAGLKPKVNSARSRLEKKLLGRGGGGAGANARTPAPTKKQATSTNVVTPPVTKMVRTTNSTTHSHSHSSSGSEHELAVETPAAVRSMEPKIEPRIVDTSKPDGRTVRSVLRGMLRYGDLTDVQLFPSSDHFQSFADEFKLPSFVSRAALETHCKLSEERVLALACEIGESVRRALEDDKKDALKFGDVEMKPSQIIERLYENLKLRVAVQRALFDAGVTASKAKGPSAAYVLVSSKHADAAVLGIGRDFPAWSWAEREHDWNSKKDAALLIGIYIHGFGSWEDILNDDRLLLQQQRALKGERLKKRAENLMKRVPPPLPGAAGEPRVVQIAAAMLNGGQTPSQNLGVQINAIVNGGVSVVGGRMVVEESSRKNPPQSNGSHDRERERSRERSADKARNGDRERGRDSSKDRDRDRERDRGHDRDRDRGRDRDRDRDRERGRDRDRDREPAVRKPSVSSPPKRAPSRSPRPETVADETRESTNTARREPSSSSSSSKNTSKRAASDEATSNGNKATGGRGDDGHSPRKKSKHRDNDASASRSSSTSKSSRTKKKSSSSSSSSSKRRRSSDRYVDKWEPEKRLREIRQVLKKVKIMSDWSKTQSDVVVVDKMFEYVATIGEHIDKAVVASEKNGDVTDTQRDQYCSALWTYAAEFTPFPAVTFERLYDDICADGERLRDAAVPASRRQSTAATS